MPKASYFIIRRVIADFNDHGDESDAIYFKPRALHQLALTCASLGDNESALTYFREALKQFSSENFIGRGRATRDYGWWLYSQEETEGEGINQLELALELLMQDTSSQMRRQREIAVTKGFLARVESRDNPRKALETMLWVDKELRGGYKWIYELDNLKFLIPLLPAASRPPYKIRAKAIQARIQLSENLLLLSQDVEEGRIVRAFTGFGIRSLKSVL